MTELDLEEIGRGELLLYQSADGRTRVECRFEDDTLWLTQGLMAELFQTTPQNVTLHLRTLYKEGEILEEATCKDYLQVRLEGERRVQRAIKHYSLDAILAVGYRVRSPRGTQFRQWATERLREYLVKGFTMDDERLRNPPVKGSGVPDYFDELLERIRDMHERSTSVLPPVAARCLKRKDSVQTSRRWKRPPAGFLLVPDNC